MAGGVHKLDNWGRGAHNRNTSDRLPEGFFRHAENLDAVGGGKLQLRAGYRSVLAGVAVRGALALGDNILLADGANLIEFSTRTQSSRLVHQIAAAGELAGCVHDAQLYFCTANETLRYDGETIRPWGVPGMAAQPPVQLENGGALIAGTYGYAATFIDAAGLEGGTGPAQAFLCTGGQRAQFDLPLPPAGGRVRLYVGRADSTSLYLQHEQFAAGPLVISGLRDDVTQLETQFHVKPPTGGLLASHKGRIFIASEKTVWMTAPLQPHLVRISRDFFQFPTRVSVLAPVEGGVFIVADKTYFISGEGAAIQQRVIDGSAAVAGSQAILPDRRVAWMTEYGPVIGNADGSLQFITKSHYVPETASHGRSTLLQRNGNELLITTQRGIPRAGLGMGDFITHVEIIAP